MTLEILLKKLLILDDTYCLQIAKKLLSGKWELIIRMLGFYMFDKISKEQELTK